MFADFARFLHAHEGDGGNFVDYGLHKSSRQIGTVRCKILWMPFTEKRPAMNNGNEGLTRRKAMFQITPAAAPAAAAVGPMMAAAADTSARTNVTRTRKDPGIPNTAGLVLPVA